MGKVRSPAPRVAAIRTRTPPAAEGTGVGARVTSSDLRPCFIPTTTNERQCNMKTYTHEELRTPTTKEERLAMLYDIAASQGLPITLWEEGSFP
jgi:hypothetical protein